MNKKMYGISLLAAVALLAIVIGHYLKQSDTSQTRPLALINLGDHPWILQAQQQIKPMIDSIIKDEILHVNPNATNIPEFYSKQRHLITLLYSKQVPVDMEQSVIDAFKSISKTASPAMSQLKFSDHIKLFGKDQTELVVTIDDPHQCLPRLRKYIIENLPSQLHKSLATQQHNQFEFAPHETLGRIPFDKIEELSNKDIVEKIRQRVLNEIPSILQKLSETNIIKPTEMFVYGNDFKPVLTQSL